MVVKGEKMWERGGCQWSAKYDMGTCCKTVIGVRSGMYEGRWRGGQWWSLGHNIGAGVDEGASATHSGRVVARKQRGVCG